jgi:periplasmic divalent cation tolerance protein
VGTVADALELHITAPTADQAGTMARALVEERLCACVNIVPGVRSIYRYDDKIWDEPEVLCIAKTRAALFERVCQRVFELHPYDVPEILAFKVHDSSKAYIDWLHGSVAVTERGLE